MNKVSFSFGAAFGRSALDSCALRAKYVDAALAAQRWINTTPFDTEGHGWMALPDCSTAQVAETAEWLRGYDSVIQVGIGGSALGNLMLNQALLDGFYNETEAKPKFYLADNPDPDKTRSIWERVKGGKIALVGVSKSGSTAETMTQFLWYRDEMLKKGQSDKDILVITDPEKGIFRAFAKDSDCRVMELPASVGGRYSVLCPAGLVTAAALGIDAAALLRGAAAMRELVSKETRIDILVTPIVTILAGIGVSALVAAPIGTAASSAIIRVMTTSNGCSCANCRFPIARTATTVITKSSAVRAHTVSIQKSPLTGASFPGAWTRYASR